MIFCSRQPAKAMQTVKVVQKSIQVGWRYPQILHPLIWKSADANLPPVLWRAHLGPESFLRFAETCMQITAASAGFRMTVLGREREREHTTSGFPGQPRNIVLCLIKHFVPQGNLHRVLSCVQRFWVLSSVISK